MPDTPAAAAPNQDDIGTLTRIIGGGLVAAAFVIGWQAFIAAGVAATGLYAYQQHQRKQERDTALLDVFRDDIAALQNKRAEDVTLEDMRQVGREITVIQKPLDYNDHHEKIRIASEAVSALVIVGGLVTAAFTLPQLVNLGTISLPHIMFSMVVGGALAMGHKVVEAAAQMFFGKENSEQGIAPDVMDLARQVTHEPLSPVQVFGVLAKADPALNNDIRQRYGSEFDRLAIAKKEAVVKEYEPQYRAIALTHEINHNNIKPSLIGFLAYGQASDALPDYQKYKALFNQPVLTSAETEEGSKHRSRLREERTEVTRLLH